MKRHVKLQRRWRTAVLSATQPEARVGRYSWMPGLFRSEHILGWSALSIQQAESFRSLFCVFVGWTILWMSVKSIWSMAWLDFEFLCWFYCLDDLLTSISWYWNPLILLCWDLCLSLLASVCFIKQAEAMLGAYVLILVIFSLFCVSPLSCGDFHDLVWLILAWGPLYQIETELILHYLASICML